MIFCDYKKILSGGGIILILIPGLFLAIPKKAKAIVPVIDATAVTAIEEASVAQIAAIEEASAAQLISDQENFGPGAIPFSAGDNLRQLRLKETGPVSTPFPPTSWDGIAYSAAQILLHSLSQSIIDWVKGGFQGGPGFITDYESFFLDAADQATGRFMKDFLSPEVYNTICSPFRLQLQLAINLSMRSRYADRMSCTASTVLNNAENFYTALDQSSWDDWITVTGAPQNNFGGSFLTSMDELYSQRRNAKENAKTESVANQGFLSMKQCSEKYLDEWTGEEVCTKYETTSPGKWVQTQLSDATGIDFQRLNLADELNEIITAIVGQLISMTLRELKS